MSTASKAGRWPLGSLHAAFPISMEQKRREQVLAQLRGASLREDCLYGTNLRNADLTAADLSGACLVDARLPVGPKGCG
ncbi:MULTISPECIES: pentapeptide repeat-containing protein [Synechococcaceae]|uniref:pentapeptide repeat-containing protein n=1 Tax=Synechococcaceae TaxID=1890426 RepID=UPI001F3B1B38|nr:MULTISPECIES: pentapeptide repeat-containing protein [Synechococcaceae]MCT4365643.1 pentapeptide repeat-containing protein [Candidatus Regnicoccus frigidus MAG-AL1]MCT4368609.1 pentapeptide repeat-containing protein [Candidatus Regnicoccus frigidus MAG-AL2]